MCTLDYWFQWLPMISGVHLCDNFFCENFKISYQLNLFIFYLNIMLNLHNYIYNCKLLLPFIHFSIILSCYRKNLGKSQLIYSLKLIILSFVDYIFNIIIIFSKIVLKYWIVLILQCVFFIFIKNFIQPIFKSSNFSDGKINSKSENCRCQGKQKIHFI